MDFPNLNATGKDLRFVNYYDTKILPYDIININFTTN
jgi:hypothetical protein